MTRNPRHVDHDLIRAVDLGPVDFEPMAPHFSGAAFLEAQYLVQKRPAARKARWQAAYDAFPALGSEGTQAAGCVCSPGIEGNLHGLAFWLRRENLPNPGDV